MAPQQNTAHQSLSTTELRDKILQMRGFLGDTVPPTMAKILSPERIATLLISAAARNDSKILQCTLSSIAQTVSNSTSLGLELNGPLGHAYLVPFYKRGVGYVAQLVIGYRGYIMLARRSDKILSIEAHCAYENDKFEVYLGSDPRIVHEPKLRGDRGEIVAAYSMAKFVGGGSHCDFMTASEIRQNVGYLKAKRDGYGPWIDHFGEMARKTVIRRACKWYPMTVEMLDGLSRDEDGVGPSGPGGEPVPGGVYRDRVEVERTDLDPPDVVPAPAAAPRATAPQSPASAAKAQIEQMTQSMRRTRPAPPRPDEPPQD